MITAADRFTADWWHDVLLDVPLRIVALLVVAFVVRYLLHKLINRLVARTVDRRPPQEVLGSTHAARIVFGSTGAYSERRSLRAETMGSVFRSSVTVLIGVIVVVMILDILGYSVGPLLASAGIAGVALGFGAQNLVKDFLAGAAMLLEDQYGIGDVVDMGEASGVVEAVSLRVTRLRAIDGTVWYVRNGEVMRLGNSSQDWARAVVDVGVAYESDTARVRRLLEEIAVEMAGEEVWADLVLEEPEVWGVEQLAADSIVIRLVVKTRPLEQWKVARELRERIKRRFDAEGVEIPFPQRALWIKQESPDSAAAPKPPAEQSEDTADEQVRKALRNPGKEAGGA
ncbi:small conductance mechanosensitive channel [Haloactinopolyspora alba]|uniref:Small conductance mechanosensitive channel n=1 Tax=Haloactinopolyspora alba TaxID=648780 RepID=A0A2P8DHD5_9ACTN|nr:mechanosensitive ion channel family protein [Haloactinopolyspora alba]PSK96630.1 small conductance mechanosensitive channel [Haloactinopolyspora alba]